MKISIIIPTYNYGHYIIHALDSIYAQRDSDIEIIIIDDGSTDDTSHIVKKYSASTQSSIHLQYIQQQNQGPACARNRGAELATGDYLLFLDADDRLLPDALKKYRYFLSERGWCDAVFAGHQSVDANGKTRTVLFKNSLITSDGFTHFKNYLFKKIPLSNGAALIRKTVFNTLRYPEQLRNSEDIVFFAQLLALYRCAFLNEPLIAVYKHADSLRRHASYAKDVNIRLVDALFDAKILPAKLLHLRRRYCAQRYLSLFRTLYLAGDYRNARRFYHQAVKTQLSCLLEWPYLRKYLKTLLKS